jgi:DNA-binding transcriptional ArsR family regulator
MKTDYLDELPRAWRPAAQVFAALGDPMRQKILLLFEAGEEISIKRIADVFPLSRTAIVHHLHVLEQAGILALRREGKAALYAVRPETVFDAVTRVRNYIIDNFPDRE